MASNAGAPVDDPDRGRRISKYEILTRLSVGGMAELFLAFTSGPGGFRKFVALKQILPDVKTEEFVKMFLDEARITAAFSHANIGQVFDLGEEEGELYLAMEFLAGQNLEQLMKASSKLGEPLPPGFAARVIRDACLALHYAHHFVDPTGKAVAVVHRDMSPRNVMVTYDGGVKVIDFGIAKAKGRLGRTAVGMVKGTGGYMSPEQVRNHELDGRSDLFSAGVLLYEMLCGRRLFNAPGDAAMMLQIVQGEIPPPRTINPNVPEPLEAVVLRALTRDKNKRFATGREMAKAIEQAMGQELFDEERMSSLMAELFEEKRQKTRALLEYANRDDARISEAAGALQDDAGESLLGAGANGAKVTPKPRAGASAGPRPSSPGRARKPGSDPSQAPAPSTARVPRIIRPPSRQDMPVAPPYQAPAQAAEEEEGATTAPSMAPLESHPGRAAPKRPPARARTKTPVESAAVEAQDQARGEKSGWLGKLVLLLILAGLGGLLYLEPVRAMFKPGYESAVAWVKTELELTPPPPPEEKPWPPPPPPGRPQNPLAQAEPAPAPAQPEAPTEAEPAEPLEPPEKLSATTTKPSPSKPGTSRPKSEPSRPGAGTPSPTGTPSKPQNLEEQVAASPQTTLEVDPSGEAEVVDTSSPKALRKAGMGLLTLATVPPAAVFEGQTSLGTTPLRKVPLLAGTYRLRIVDSDGVSRLFSAPVELAKERKYTIRVSDLPLYPE